MFRAGVLEGINRMVLQDRSMPAINSQEVLVQVKCAAICGSDIPRVKVKGTYSFPTIPGHEFSGVIFKTGEEVSHLREGDRVTVYPLIPCDNCSFCNDHKFNLCENYNYLGSRCDGGFAEFVRCPAKNVIRLPASVSFEDAALVEPMAVAFRGVKKGEVCAGQRVVVFGLGAIGLFAIQWARVFGASLIIGVDRNKHKLDLGVKMGAQRVIDSQEGNFREKLLEMAGEGGADVVLECSGANVFADLAVSVVKKQGMISIVGNPKGDVVFGEKTYSQILRKEITMKGCWNSLISSQEHEWNIVLGHIAERNVVPSLAITHRFDLGEISQVFDDLFEQKIEGYCKGVFVLGGAEK